MRHETCGLHQNRIESIKVLSSDDFLFAILTKAEDKAGRQACYIPIDNALITGE